MDKYQRESKSAIANWLSTESWNYFITLRPLKTMLKDEQYLLPRLDKQTLLCSRNG